MAVKLLITQNNNVLQTHKWDLERPVLSKDILERCVYPDYYDFDPNCMEWLAQIVEKTGCFVGINDWGGREKILKEIFKSFHIDPVKVFMIPSGKPWEQDVEYSLKKFSKVKRFVVIAKYTSIGKYEEHNIRTRDDGLSQDIVIKVIARLNG